MESYYEINVAKDGVHLFATAPRSIRGTDIRKFNLLVRIMKEKFPEEEGYSISATYWNCSGQILQLQQ